jgi:predicted acyltransferase
MYHILFITSSAAIYLGFMYGYPVPPFKDSICGMGVVSEECNFGAYLDRSIFKSKAFMLYPNDPEGLFTTLSSFTNTLAGLAFSLLMRHNT